MRLRLTVGIAIALAFLLIHAGNARANDGSCSLPEKLQSAIKVRYLSTRLVTLADLGEGIEHFLTGTWERLSRFGKGRLLRRWQPDSGFSIDLNAGGKQSAELVLAHEVAQKWETVLLDNAGASMPVVWSQGPGEYEEFNSEKKIRATRPVIVFCGYGSWQVLYAWTGSKISKIWLQD